jgi:hypothetical protein
MKIWKFFLQKKYPNESFNDNDFADIILTILIALIIGLVLMYQIIKKGI